MIKYVKWFLLIILIICLIIIGIKFDNYENKDEFVISDIYNFSWYKKGIAVYENGELISENKDIVSSNYYMVFTKEKVSYYNLTMEKFDEYSYSYNDGKITINSEDYFISKGTYNIAFNDDLLELSIKDNKTEYVYYFERSVG